VLRAPITVAYAVRNMNSSVERGVFSSSTVHIQYLIVDPDTANLSNISKYFPNQNTETGWFGAMKMLRK
jgi:hypothetical protein